MNLLKAGLPDLPRKVPVSTPDPAASGSITDALNPSAAGCFLLNLAGAGTVLQPCLQCMLNISIPLLL